MRLNKKIGIRTTIVFVPKVYLSLKLYVQEQEVESLRKTKVEAFLQRK